MHPNALLELSTELLHRVLQLKHPADGVVSDFFREHRALGSRERHALAETTYAVLRQRLLFQHLAQSGKGEMERRLAILGWQGNEGFLRGALSETEQQWLAQVQKVDRSALPERLRHNLPEWLAERLHAELGDEFWPLVESIPRRRRWTCASTPSRPSAKRCRPSCCSAGVRPSRRRTRRWVCASMASRRCTSSRCSLRGDVEVQDEGSQLLALLTDAKRGEMVVDFCAGAGGKTLALGAAMRNTGRLYAFDTSGHRLAALKPRLARSGLSNVYPAQIAHERDDRIKRLAGKIDRVLVDAPCSGLGTLRRNPDLKWRQTPGVGAGTASTSRPRSSPARRGCSNRAGGWSTRPAACSGRERGDRRRLHGGTCPRVPPLAADVSARTCARRTARNPGERRFPEVVAASPPDRRLLRCGVATDLIGGKLPPTAGSSIG